MSESVAERGLRRALGCGTLLWLAGTLALVAWGSPVQVAWVMTGVVLILLAGCLAWRSPAMMLATAGYGLMAATAWAGAIIAAQRGVPSTPLTESLFLLAFVVGHALILGSLVMAGYQQATRPVVAWTCRGCGHDLFGLTEPRCPECGTALMEDQIRLAPPGMLRSDPAPPASL